jgi:hypothetical protein
MALNTFGAIKTAVADWAYTGGDVTSALVGTDFFPQVQSKMYNGDGQDIEPLRIQSMVASAAITPAAGGVITISSQVDAGWLEFIEITSTSTGAQSANYLPPWKFRKEAGLLADTASPQFLYTIEGDSLLFAPKATGPVNAVWYEKFTALSADGDTDWIVANAPHVYLDGCLMLACAYADDPRESQFRQKFAAAIRGLNLNDKRRRSSGGTPIARPRNVV